MILNSKSQTPRGPKISLRGPHSQLVVTDSDDSARSSDITDLIPQSSPATVLIAGDVSVVVVVGFYDTF